MRKFKKPATEIDYFADYPADTKALTTVHKCPRCGQFCKVEFIQEYEWSVRVSSCCGARNLKVLRYAQTNS